MKGNKDHITASKSSSQHDLLSVCAEATLVMKMTLTRPEPLQQCALSPSTAFHTLKQAHNCAHAASKQGYIWIQRNLKLKVKGWDNIQATDHRGALDAVSVDSNSPKLIVSMEGEKCGE